jgi:hypothetical protein
VASILKVNFVERALYQHINTFWKGDKTPSVSYNICVISDFRHTPTHTAGQFVTEWPVPSSRMAHRSTGAEPTAAGYRILLEHSEACRDILSIWNDEGSIQNRKQSVAVAIYKNGYKCNALRRIVDSYLWYQFLQVPSKFSSPSKIILNYRRIMGQCKGFVQYHHVRY